MIGMECECNEANGTLIGVLFKAWKQHLKHETWSFRRMKRRHNRSLKRPEKGEASEAMKPSHGTVWESLKFCVDFCSNFVFCDFSQQIFLLVVASDCQGSGKDISGGPVKNRHCTDPLCLVIFILSENSEFAPAEPEHPSTLVCMYYKTEKTSRCYKRFKEKWLMLIKLPPILESELRSDRGILYSISAESLLVGCKALGCLCRHHLLRTEGRRAGQAVLAVPWARKGGGEEGSDDSCPSPVPMWGSVWKRTAGFHDLNLPSFFQKNDPNAIPGVEVEKNVKNITDSDLKKPSLEAGG